MRGEALHPQLHSSQIFEEDESGFPFFSDVCFMRTRVIKSSRKLGYEGRDDGPRFSSMNILFSMTMGQAQTHRGLRTNLMRTSGFWPRYARSRTRHFWLKYLSWGGGGGGNPRTNKVFPQRTTDGQSQEGFYIINYKFVHICT